MALRMSPTNKKDKEMLRQSQLRREVEQDRIIGFQTSKVQDINTDFHFQIQNPNMSIIIDKRKIDCVTLVTVPK